MRPGCSTRARRREALSRSARSRSRCRPWRSDVIDMAIQLHGGGGPHDDFPLAAAWVGARSLRLADGPDEVHRGVIARIELAKYTSEPRVLVTGGASRSRAPRWSASSRARGDQVLVADLADGRGAERDRRRTVDSTSRPRTTGTRLRVVRASGVASTSWSTTPASPAAAASSCARWTSGSGSSTSTCSAWCAACRAFTPMFKRAGLRPHRQHRLAGRAGASAGHGLLQRGQGGVVAFSETTGARAAPYGVECSVVCPSYFRTNLSGSMRGADRGSAQVDRAAGDREVAGHRRRDRGRGARRGSTRGDERDRPRRAGRAAYALKLGRPRRHTTRLMRQQAARLEGASA